MKSIPKILLIVVVGAAVEIGVKDILNMPEVLWWQHLIYLVYVMSWGAAIGMVLSKTDK